MPIDNLTIAISAVVIGLFFLYWLIVPKKEIDNTPPEPKNLRNQPYEKMPEKMPKKPHIIERVNDTLHADKPELGPPHTNRRTDKIPVIQRLFDSFFEPKPPYQGVVNVDYGRVYNSLPKLFVANKCLNAIADGINAFKRGTETGYALMGMIETDSILINGLIDPGPKAEYSYGHVKFDRDYQQEELNKVQLVSPEIGQVGDVHLHPGRMNTCSGGDLTTDSNNVRLSASQEMIFIIVTRIGAGGGIFDFGQTTIGKHVLKFKELQFNFYYLGKNSRYQYCPIEPQVVTVPAVCVSPPLERYYEEHPVRAKLDLGLLKELPNHSLSVLNSAEHLVLKIMNDSLQYKLVIKHNGSEAPTCQVSRDGNIEPLFIESVASWNPAIWFTQICIEVEKLMSSKYPKVEEPQNARRIVQANQRSKSKGNIKSTEEVSPIKWFGGGD